MPVARLLALLAEERGEIGLVWLHAALAGLLGLALPVGVQAIIGLVGGGMVLQPVVILIAAVVAGTALAGLVQVLQLAAVERLQQRIFARLSLDWGARIPRLRAEALGGHDLPESVNRFFEVVVIQKGLAKLLTEASAAALAMLFGLLLLTLYHPSLSIAGTLLLALLGLSLRVTGSNGLRTSLAESEAKYRVAHWLQELARRLWTFRATGADTMPVARTDAEVADYLRARQAHFRVLVRQHATAVAFRTLITGALLVLGTVLVVQRKITLGQFVASELVVVSILASVEMLTLSLTTLYDVLTSAEKLGHVADLPTATGPHADGRGIVPTASSSQGAEVSARALSYIYPDVRIPAVANVTLRVQAGERVAITGTEGSGETTLLALLGGLRDGYEGALELDGVSVRDIDGDALRRRVGYVAQEPGLFDGTLIENVAVGRAWVSDTDVRDALAFAGLSELVASLPLGLRTPVGAMSLPSNAARKIALARALAGRPSLLLFDEFFHHLEPVFKRELLERLLHRDAGWTVIAVSHDPIYLAACDRIHVLSEGRVVREGTFETLLADPEFAARVRAQTERLVATV